LKERPPLPTGPYLVVGLARSGIAAALALHARGLEVVGADSRRPAAAELAERHIEVHLGREPLELLDRAGAVVKSPGVPSEAPLVAGARARGIPVVGELELAWRMLPCEFLAVTGTNGKTTTSELIGHLHRRAGRPVAVAGNVGTALSSLALPGALSAAPAPTVVCETSSFQLEDATAFAPEVAVLLNLSADHLDRHGDLDAYRAAKLRIFAWQGEQDVAVLPAGLQLSPSDLGARARELRFGSARGARGAVYEDAGSLWCADLDEPLLSVAELSLRGPHNVQNAMAAAVVCLARGIDVQALRAGLRDFAGVPHRLEELGSKEGVLYVNDSKATNVASTLVALRAFDRLPRAAVEGPSAAGGAATASARRAPQGPAAVQAPPRAQATMARSPLVHLILGGQGKGQDFTPLRAALEHSARAIYLIGEDAPRVAGALEGIAPPVRMCETMERACEAAATAASRGEVILLSPGCASFDQFADFEARGERFREIFSAL
jgi:UDP-N-acetylmuramoylalanine--D-glutamate ligase